MPQIGTLFLVHLFSALLPPLNPEDRDYYAVLDVPHDASNEQIRKAYKVKSLKLHPDKIAQRGNQNKEEAAAEYEKVQEAYGVLVNDEKRQRYNSLGYSPTRYQFVARGNLGNPSSMYTNLTSATFVDKTRLVILAMVCLMIVLVQPILIATKINHLLEQRGALEDSKWTHVLIPFWILDGLACLFWCSIVLFVPSSARVSVFITALEQMAWYVGIFFLALRWDGTWTMDYSIILIPIYIAMAFKWTQMAAVLKKIKRDVHRMVSPEYLEKEILKGKPLEDLTEEERQEIISDFLVVTVPADFIPDETEGEGGEAHQDEDDIETQKVEASPEYKAATEIYDSTFGTLFSSFIFGIVFLIVLTLKLDDHIDANWWTVFTPIWVYFGSRLVFNLYLCMCGGGMGNDEIILQMHEHQQQKEKEMEQVEKKDTNNNNTSGGGEVKDDNGGKKIDDDDHSKVRKDNDFVGPEDSIRAFGEEDTKEKDDSEAKDDRPDDEVADDIEKGKEKEKQANKEVKGADMPKGEKQSEEKMKGSDKAEDDADDDDDDFHIDEDTFRAFQSAYAEAEQDAMQEQAKASTNCCNVCFQLLLICLVVAKLEKSYRNDDPDDVGFNTFWIIFPFFLFFGLICCTCACLVYGAGPDDTDDSVPEEGGGEADEENPAPKTEDLPPIAAMPPPPATATPIIAAELSSVAHSVATETANSAAESKESSIPNPVSHQSSSIEDLD